MIRSSWGRNFYALFLIWAYCYFYFPLFVFDVDDYPREEIVIVLEWTTTSGGLTILILDNDGRLEIKYNALALVMSMQLTNT